MKLLLEDGTEFLGYGFGAEAAVAGEVVFNTAMTGYVEALTDPSYTGQILVFTQPLIGNYGVPVLRAPGSLERPFESDRIQTQGVVVQNYVAAYSHHAAAQSLGEWLIESGVPAIAGIDTRNLTQRLREYGTMKGWLIPHGVDDSEAREQVKGIDMREEVFMSVAPTETLHYRGGGLEIGVIDIGAKDNIIRSLLSRGASVTRVPWWMDLWKHVESADGIVIGNGPGDPKDLHTLIEQIRGILNLYNKPVLGICLGHQVLALAAGGDTYKLPYGHRGINQPVQDLLTRRCFITSQNHGYAVSDEALPPGWEPWFVNTNDGTNEGIRSRNQPFCSVQFHPEASPGPQDTGYLFDDFLRMVGAIKQG